MTRRHRMSHRVTVALAVGLAVGSVAAAAAASATPVTPAPQASSPAPAPAPSTAGATPGTAVADPDHTLPGGWRTSDDTAVSVVGDGTGLHLLRAREDTGYRWDTVATLGDPRAETSGWIGQACVTQSGAHAVVVYAPREFAQRAALAARGARAAVVDLATGAVHQLPGSTSLAYFNPGCGAGESAVLTQEGGEDLPGTRLRVVDTATATLGAVVTTSQQVSSAVPTAAGIVAATAGHLVTVAPSGAVTGVVAASGTPYDLTVDAAGAVLHADHVGSTARIRRTLGRTTTTLATGALTGSSIQRGGNGRVFLGGVDAKGALPTGVSVAPDVSPDEQLSSTGALAVRRGQASRPGGVDAQSATTLSATVRATRRHVEFRVPITSGAAPTAAVPGAPHATPATAGSPTSPVDADRTCAVARNDATVQVYQPTPRQSEWAVDQAVRHALTVARPANWRHDGLPAYTPQGLFPAPGLTGAGGFVPAQIMLGVLTQESNLQQASTHALSGEYGNPLVGNFYGTDIYNDDPSDDWQIDFADADCGYGIAQVTDGMRTADTSRTATAKKAIAVDYAANIAAGVAILESKWNQLAAVGITANDGGPSSIENWYLALWAYNSGYHPAGDPAGDGTTSGLGWANNPANPHYPPYRSAFMDVSYADAAHPQDWPYQEKVIGFAGHPIDTPDGVGYRAAWWNSTDARSTAQPPVTIACTASNTCLPGQKFTPNDPSVSDEPPGPCAHKSPAGLYNLQCWWHARIVWKGTCATTCGHELERFDPGQYPEQPDGTHYPPSCTSTASGVLPSNAIVVDDVPTSVSGLRCGTRPTSSGSFGLSFAADASGHYEGKIDFHQLAGGYGGHFWFSHAEPSGSPLTVTGTWTPPTRLTGWTRVMVHVPDHGAWTQQAHYRIWTGARTWVDRYVPTDIEKNSWVSLGVVNFSDPSYSPKLTLDNVTLDAEPDAVNTAANVVAGAADIAWDAAAFVPLTAKPRDMVVQVGDSYSSGEGAEPYQPGSDRGSPLDGNGVITGSNTWDACRRSTNSWIRKAVLPGQTSAVGALADSLDPTMDFHTVACSGAFTYNLTDKATGGTNYYGYIGQHHEVRQLDAGFLDANTTLVTLTLGGNDAGFGDIVTSCGKPTEGCPSDASIFAREDATRTPIAKTLAEIHRKAPNARIVLLGYPELFDAPLAPCMRSFMAASSMPHLNTAADHLATVQQRAVADANAQAGSTVVTFRWGNAEFSGSRICDAEAAQGINDVVAAPTGPGDFSCPVSADPRTYLCISMESYHPNNRGTTIYARVLQNALRQ